MSRRWVASPRRRRRNVLLLVGLLPSLVALGAALALLLMLFRQANGVTATDQGRHDEARDWFAANRGVATVERWIAPFNEGVASYRDREFDGALVDFLAALEVAPPEAECLIRHNIALARERLADNAAADDSALKSYRAARLALSSAGCLERDLGSLASRVEGVDVEDDEGDEDDREDGEAAGGVGRDSLPELSQRVDDRLVDKIEALLAERRRSEAALLSAEERTRAERREEVNQDAEREDQRRQDDVDAPAEQPPGEDPEEQAPGEDPGDQRPDEDPRGPQTEDYGW